MNAFLSRIGLGTGAGASYHGFLTNIVIADTALTAGNIQSLYDFRS